MFQGTVDFTLTDRGQGVTERLTALVQDFNTSVASERTIQGSSLRPHSPSRFNADLHQRYSRSHSVSFLSVYLKFYLKKCAWAVVVGGSSFIKRSLDVVVSAGLLVLSMPLLVLAALLIKLTDGGPVLFWQPRVGRWGRTFSFPKFRSMVVNAEELKKDLLAHNHHGDSITFKMARDPRVTQIGRFLRKSSIDELPQLWCVLKGDMSLVGPRPPTLGEVKFYSLADRRRLDATPGLTCIWQVSGRGNIGFSRHLELDIEYIESQSLALDLKLLLLTIPAVLSGRGAY